MIGAPLPQLPIDPIPDVPKGEKNLYFHIVATPQGKVLKIDTNAKDRSKLGDVAIFIDSTAKQKISEGAAENLQTLEKLAAAEKLYNACEEARVQKVNNSFWVRCFKWVITYFKPKEFFEGKKLDLQLSPHIERLQIRERTKERLLEKAAVIKERLAPQLLLAEAHKMPIHALPHDFEARLSRANSQELLTLQEELETLQPRIEADIQSLQRKDAQANAHIVQASLTSAAIKKASHELLKAKDEARARVELAELAHLHLEIAPQFREFLESVLPLHERAKKLREQAGSLLAFDEALQPLLKQVAALVDSFTALRVAPEMLTQEKLAQGKSIRDRNSQELNALDTSIQQLASNIQARFQAQKAALQHTLTEVSKSYKALPYPVAALGKQIDALEKKLAASQDPFTPPDSSSEKELEMLAREVSKRAMTGSLLKEQLHYYSLAKKIDPALSEKPVLLLWESTGQVDEGAFVKQEHKAALLPALLKQELPQLKMLLKDPWIKAVRAEAEVHDEIATRTKALYSKTLAAELATLKDANFQKDIEAEFTAKAAGLDFEALPDWKNLLHTAVVKRNEEIDHLKALQVQSDPILTLLPAMRALYNKKAGKAHALLERAESTFTIDSQAPIATQIRQLELAYKVLREELISAPFLAHFSENPALQHALTIENWPNVKKSAESWIQKINDEDAALREVQTDWKKAQQEFLAAIQTEKAKYRLEDTHNKIAKALLDAQEGVVIKTTAPTSLSLNLKGALEKFKTEKESWMKGFSTLLDGTFKSYKAANVLLARARSEAEALLSKNEKLLEAERLVGFPILPGLQTTLMELKPLLESTTSIKPDELAAQSERLKVATQSFKRTYEARMQHTKTEIAKKFVTLKEGITACRKACKGSDFKNAIVIPSEPAPQKSILDLAKEVKGLEEAMKRAQSIKAMDLLATQYATQASKLIQETAPILQETERLAECYRESPDLRDKEMHQLLELQAAELSNILQALKKEKLPPINDGFTKEIERRATELQKLEKLLPQKDALTVKAKKSFDEFAESLMSTVQGEIDATTEILKRIEGAKEGHKEELQSLQSCLSQERGANWAHKLSSLADKSHKLNRALQKVLEVSEQQLLQRKKELGPVEKRMLTALKLQPDDLQNKALFQAALAVELEAIKAAGNKQKSALCQKVFESRYALIQKNRELDVRYILSALCELQALAEPPTPNSNRIAAVLGLRKLIQEIAPLSGKAEELVQAFYGLKSSEMGGHFIDPNIIGDLTTKEIDIFKTALLKELQSNPATHKQLVPFLKDL